jgi:hypothetical protein
MMMAALWLWQLLPIKAVVPYLEELRGLEERGVAALNGVVEGLVRRARAEAEEEEQAEEEELVEGW